MALGARGRVAALADVSAGTTNGGLTQAPAPPQRGTAPGLGPFSLSLDTSTWTWVIFGAAVLYLMGAYVVLGRYRVPV